MITDKKIISLAQLTLQTEADSITQLKNLIGKNFVECVKIIFFSKGRIIVTGIGKSAIISQKIVSTLNSTGTPAVFMHAADAVHGDLGIIQGDDVVLCVSHSGNTAEIKVIVPLLKNSGNKLIAMTGEVNSYLAKNADVVLNVSVVKEACPMNLAPTSSTAAQMAMGDALAICLLECRGFTKEDFARFHPGGALGKKLYLKISDLYPNNPRPEVFPGDAVKKVILEISSKRLGATAVVKNKKLLGIITDGDLRRMLETKKSIDDVIAKDIMTARPKTVSKDMMAVDALQLMKKHNITQVVVTDKGKYLGFVHLHDLLREGII
ncbi:MAG TPA: KpsF/GutQ family sugar-phosphate isomerase [Bacteroidia bacterium]|nr:KpsF/GutQ family sugar-phosphate isomerase [Bacteroidia bacterium]